MTQKLKTKIAIILSLLIADPSAGFAGANSNDTEEMENLVVRAQNAYFNAPIEEVISAFKKVTLRRLESHWSKDIRNSIVYSYGRLAQLDPNNESHWLEELYTYDSAAQLSTEIFSPKTIEAYQKTKESLSEMSVAWTGNNLPKEVESVSLNGEEFSIFDLKKKIYKHADYLLTMSSTRFDTLTLKLKGSDLISNTEWNLKFKKPDGSRLADQPRVLPHKASNSSLEEPIDLLSKEDLATDQEFKPVLGGSTLNASTSENRTWLWVALGAIATGVTIYLIDQNSKSKGDDETKKKPTHTEAGFRFSF